MRKLIRLLPPSDHFRHLFFSARRLERRSKRTILALILRKLWCKSDECGKAWRKRSKSAIDVRAI